MRGLHRFLSVVAALLFSSVAVAQSQISISLTPSSTSLTTGKSTTFEATVRGTNVPGVMWSLMPAIGTLTVSSTSSTWEGTSATPTSTVKVTYTAPPSIDEPRAVMVVAISYADSTKAASATVWLSTAVAIAVTPSSASVSAGNSVKFTTSLAGSFNTGVSWSLSPAVGTIADGLYTAPMNIETLQTIVLTAASLADPSKLAQASITLIPSRPTSISISPAQATLQPGQSKQFIATVLGGSANVWWSINPMVGSISPSGLYTPPNTVTNDQVITVTAGISSDPTKTATAQVTLASPTPPPPLPPIQLPIEMIGLDGMTSTISFNIPPGSNLNGPIKLLMKVHGLRYQTQASVQINSSGWIPINDSTVALLGNAKAFGGIGGGFSVLQMTLPVPLTSINIGTNTLSFRFNGTDGKVSGFRVLSFNFLAGDGSSLLPSTAFVYEDPSTWQAPSNQPSDIAAGKTLWYTASLTVPTHNGVATIQAKCTDCHAQDGRDLKYFNYSNNSIRTRSMFHGLTAQQGDQIASYIRTLSTPAPVSARPWNPPYQPGPGMDARPISEWAAGAGIDAVLDQDADMLPYLMPGGSTANWVWNGYLNARETPIALQLPDWNRWLPSIHPVDGWGASFNNSPLNAAYLSIRSRLTPDDPTSYKSIATQILSFGGGAPGFQGVMLASPNWSDPTYVQKVYSVSLWNMVKLWEINQEFGLEAMPRAVFGPQAADRAWDTTEAFATSPFFSRLPRPSAGLDNGTMIVHIYLSFAWYQLQLILNDGNGTASGTTPIDWGYAESYPENDLTWDSTLSVPRIGTAGLLMEWLIKSLQSGFTAGGGNNSNPYHLVVFPGQVSTWSGISKAQKLQIMNSWISVWLNRYQPLTYQQISVSGQVFPTVDFTQKSMESDLAKALPLLRFEGVDATLLNQVVAWASSIWPAYNWTGALNAPCTVSSLPEIKCLVPGQ